MPFFSHPAPLYLSAAALRVGLLLYGVYTDIDYLVFTDAAALVARGASPYARETYRYTPLLAWLLVPTAWGGAAWFAWGKVVFAAADLVAGALMERVLTMQALDPPAARRFAAVWLLNPMVAAISTRGSSEGLLAVLAVGLLWAALTRRVTLAGVLLGLGVHFKIYPVIYGPAVAYWLGVEDDHDEEDAEPKEKKKKGKPLLIQGLRALATPARLRLAASSLLTLAALNGLMYALYGMPFVAHTYLHHVGRLDHRHNFSPYHVQLYLSSSSSSTRSFGVETLAFAPQLLLSCVLIPLATAKRDLATSMLAQTFAFVAFNKVCTSQYFLWYMALLPTYLPRSTFLRNRRLGLAALGLWAGVQAAWLAQAYALEFLGRSTFVPGLWMASLAFLVVNCGILGVIIGDCR